MSVADLSSALHSLAGSLSIHPNVDIGYIAAMAGIVLLIVFAVAGISIATVRVARRVWNMTPRGFLTALLVGAWVLLLIGLLTP